MKVKTEITDDELDRRFPDPHEDDGDGSWGVTVVAVSADGTRHGAVVQEDEDASPERMAEALARCAIATAALHSSAAAQAITRWIAPPADEHLGREIWDDV